MLNQQIELIDGLCLKNMFISGANNLENNKNQVNSLNVFPVPDGDTGTNMSLTMNSAIREINNTKGEDVFAVAESASNGSLMGARGNSGVILSQILRGFAKALKKETHVDCVTLANAFMEGSNTAYKAVMRPTEGTILTVIRESAEYGLKIAKDCKDLVQFMEEIVNQSNSTLNRTPEMLPILKQANVVDAGGKGLVDILSGMLYYITTKQVIMPDEIPLEVEQKESMTIYEEKDIEYGYCTEFFIKGKEMNQEQYKREIMDMGDSVIVVGNENLLKVHIHTNNPGIVLEKGLKYGYLSSIKIDNMREQHKELLINEEDRKANSAPLKYGVISVATGSGISSIFKDLGADEVIEGGQTMNPSTEDILKSIEKVNSNNIIILPNNGNIILAANQSKYLTKKNIIVAQTKTIPQGIAAVMAIDHNKSDEENEKKIEKAVMDVKTGLITYAVRDSNYNGVDIEEGSFLGILENDISTVSKDIDETIKKVIEDMIDDDSSLITIYYGNDISLNDAEVIQNRLEKDYPGCDVELHYGGQPLYYYILSVE